MARRKDARLVIDLCGFWSICENMFCTSYKQSFTKINRKSQFSLVKTQFGKETKKKITYSFLPLLLQNYRKTCLINIPFADFFPLFLKV